MSIPEPDRLALVPLACNLSSTPAACIDLLRPVYCRLQQLQQLQQHQTKYLDPPLPKHWWCITASLCFLLPKPRPRSAFTLAVGRRSRF